MKHSTGKRKLRAHTTVTYYLWALDGAYGLGRGSFRRRLSSTSDCASKVNVTSALRTFQ